MIFVVLFLAVCLLFGARAQDDNTVRTDANGKECNQHRVWKTKRTWLSLLLLFHECPCLSFAMTRRSNQLYSH